MTTTFGLTDRTKKALLAGWPADIGPSPFEHISGEDYWLSFDSIRIETASDILGGVRSMFRWRGNDIAWIRVESAGMVNGDSLTINGIEGRTRMTITG
jgi:hypothetical protein